MPDDNLLPTVEELWNGAAELVDLAELSIFNARLDRQDGRYEVFAVLDVDQLGGNGAAVFLMNLRLAHPYCQVVLTSREFRAHDLGTFRLPICYVSLARPMKRWSSRILLSLLGETT